LASSHRSTGGSTWDAQVLAGPSKNTWFPLTAGGYMVGENVLPFVKENAIPVFPAAREGAYGLGGPHVLQRMDGVGHDPIG
jgi:PAB1-binding protein PBP1